MKADLSGSQYSQTLVKALRVLETLCSDQPEWGIREIGRELGIDPSTVYRLMNTFNATGYVEQNATNQRYSLGPKVMKLARAYTFQNPLSDIAMKVFRAYSQHFVYNFYLGKLSGFQVVYLAVLDGGGVIKITVDPGASLDLHCTALGKVLLAYQSPEYINDYLERHGLPEYTTHTITDVDTLLKHLHEVRKRGYAVNRGEYIENIGSIGVPLRDGTKEVTTCVSLAYPIPLLRKNDLQIDDMIVLAKEISNEITLRLVGSAGGMDTFSID